MNSLRRYGFQVSYLASGQNRNCVHNIQVLFSEKEDALYDVESLHSSTQKFQANLQEEKEGFPLIMQRRRITNVFSIFEHVRQSLLNGFALKKKLNTAFKFYSRRLTTTST